MWGVHLEKGTSGITTHSALPSPTSDLQNGAPEATLPDAWHYWVRAELWLPCQIVGIIGSVLCWVQPVTYRMALQWLPCLVIYILGQCWIKPVTYRMTLHWLPCQMHGIIGSELNQTSDSQNGTPVATLPDPWHYWVRAESWLPLQMLGIIGSVLSRGYPCRCLALLGQCWVVATLADAWHYWVSAESWLPCQTLGITGSELSPTSDLQNGTPVTTLPDTRHYWVSASSSSAFPSYISGVHHFGWDSCVCDRF